MAKSDFVLLENLSDTTQQIFDEDAVAHSIPANARFPFPAEIAQQFLSERSSFVRIYTPLVVPASKRVDEPMVWIANMTGDPRAPKTITVQENTSKGIVDKEYSHNCHTPRTVSFKMHVDQTVHLDASGYKFAMNHPPANISIPTYETVLVPEHVANFVIQRGQSLGEEFGHLITKVRARGEFEPNPTWDVEDVWLYMELVAGDRFNKDLQRKLIQSINGLSDCAIFKTVKEAHPEKLNEVRQEVWRHAFFYLIDDRYSLPPKKAFDKLKASRARAAEKLSPAEELVNEALGEPPKRGRPRKSA